MPEVTLVLKANNSQHVNAMKQAQRATQAVYDEAEKGSIKTRGLIEKEIQIQKQLSEQRSRAKDIDNLKTYNQLLELSQKRLKELENAGLDNNKKIQKSTESNLIPSILKLGAAYLSVHTVIKALKETAFAFYTKSQEGMDLLERKTNAFKAAFAVLRGEFIQAGKNINEHLGENGNGAAGLLKKMGATASWMFNIMTGGVVKMINQKAGVTAYFDNLVDKMNKAGVAAENWTRKQQELEDAENAMIVPRAKANLAIKEARDKYAEGNGTILERIQLLQQANDLEAKTTEEEIRFQQKKIDLIRTINEEKKKVGQLQREDERLYQEALAKQLELQAQSASRTLRTTSAIKALLNELKQDYKDWTKISMKGNQTGLETGIYRVPEEMTYMDEEGWVSNGGLQVVLSQTNDFKKKMSETLEDWAKKKAHINEVIERDNKNRTEVEKKDWEDKVAIVRQGVELIDRVLTDLVDAQYENAQRQREILDNRISELEQELNTEVELYKAGYASNVNAKKVELEKTKKLRDQALMDEQAALQRKRNMEAISQGLDIASAIMSIISKTFKNSKTWWQALISAGIGVAAMYGLIASSKKQISGAVQLGKGGSGTDTGIITGRSHARGGEGFLNHVEVEHGEAWGVLNVPATKKFGKVFHHMVSSFNKGQIPVIVPAANVDNNVLVNNDGSNTRLDVLISENKKLNQKLSEGAFRDLGDRIVITKGNTVRTIRR